MILRYQDLANLTRLLLLLPTSGGENGPLLYHEGPSPSEGYMEEAALSSESIRFRMSGYPSGYTDEEVYLISAAAVCVMVVIIVGNLLVIVAIFFEYTLQCVQNWFVASLALADLAIGVLIMPFSLSQEVVGYWMFGEDWCQIYAALDILLCTASILNLTVIALDRYWSITRAIDYLNFRTEKTVTAMICLVWFLAALVSMPTLLYPPWKLPFEPPANSEIKLWPEERIYFESLNVTWKLAHSRCSVSPA